MPRTSLRWTYPSGIAIISPSGSTGAPVNHVTIVAPRNGTADHLVHPDGTGGTAVDGSAFTPTSGRLLVCLVEGAVTSTTPTGWTLPANGSAVNNTGLYVFHRAASGTSADQVATTHNGSNYPVVFDFYEFAAGSSFGSAAAETGVSASAGAGPTLSGLTGTNWTAGVLGQANGTSVAWASGTEEVDVAEPFSGTDGFVYSLTFDANNPASSVSYTATASGGTGVALERLVIAVSAV